MCGLVCPDQDGSLGTVKPGGLCAGGVSLTETLVVVTPGYKKAAWSRLFLGRGKKY